MQSTIIPNIKLISGILNSDTVGTQFQPTISPKQSVDHTKVQTCKITVDCSK